MNKTLSKSSTDRKISGVCGGIAEYLNIDSTIIRVAFALSIIFWGFGLLLYIIAAIIMPMDYEVGNKYNKNDNYYSSEKSNQSSTQQSAENAADTDKAEDLKNNPNVKKEFDASNNNSSKKSNLSTAAIFGIILIAIGAICLINIFLPAFNYGVIFAALVVALGVLIIIKGGK